MDSNTYFVSREQVKEDLWSVAFGKLCPSHEKEREKLLKEYMNIVNIVGALPELQQTSFKRNLCYSSFRCAKPGCYASLVQETVKILDVNTKNLSQYENEIVILSSKEANSVDAEKYKVDAGFKLHNFEDVCVAAVKLRLVNQKKVYVLAYFSSKKNPPNLDFKYFNPKNDPSLGFRKADKILLAELAQAVKQGKTVNSYDTSIDAEYLDLMVTAEMN